MSLASLISDSYTYRVGWDKETGVFVATCLEFPKIASHSTDRNSALTILRDYIDSVILKRLKENLEVPKPLNVKQNDN